MKRHVIADGSNFHECGVSQTEKVPAAYCREQGRKQECIAGNCECICKAGRTHQVHRRPSQGESGDFMTQTILFQVRKSYQDRFHSCTVEFNGTTCVETECDRTVGKMSACSSTRCDSRHPLSWMTRKAGIAS